MEKSELSKLDVNEIERIARDIASVSLPNALALLVGVGAAFIQKEHPTLRNIRQRPPYGIDLITSSRLFACISSLEAKVRGEVAGDHRLTAKEQVMAASSAAPQQDPVQQMN